MGKSLAIPRVIPEDWKRLDLIVNKIKMRLGSTSSPTHVGMTLTGLTASSLVGTDASKALESVTIGTGLAYARPTISFSHLGIEALTDPGADKIMFWDDSATVCKWLGAGSSLAITTTTLNTIQDIRTSASPQFAGLTITGNIVFTTDNSHIGFANPRLVFSDTNDRIEITGSLVVSTSLFLQEQNAALASIPTRGQIWTKIGDPNTLWFTDDTNVDFNIAPQHLLTTSSPTFGGVTSTGTIDASAGKVLVEDNDTEAPVTESDGYVGVAIVDGTPRIYFNVNGTMYYIDGTASAVPVTGNPMGAWLFWFPQTI